MSNGPNGHIDRNLLRHTKGTVGAQYGHVSSSSWGTVDTQLGEKAQYGHSMARFSIGTLGALLVHERVNFQRFTYCWRNFESQIPILERKNEFPLENIVGSEKSK